MSDHVPLTLKVMCEECGDCTEITPVAHNECIVRLDRELAEANRRIAYLLRVSGLGRVEAVDECIRRDNAGAEEGKKNE